MTKQYYISRQRVNARISDSLVEGYPVKIGDYTYERISRAPIGRRVLKKFRSLDEQEQIVIYG